MSSQTEQPKPVISRATRLTLLCRGATLANRQSRLSSDDPLLPGEQARLRALALQLRPFFPVFCAPERAAAETAAVFSGDAASCPALRDLDYGRWANRTITDIAQQSPDDLQDWRTDPASSPHGGEPFLAAQARASVWLESLHSTGGNTLAVTHAIVLKLLFLHVIDAPLTSLWRIDVEPLAMLTLTSDGRRWALRSFGTQLAAGSPPGEEPLG
ncbi:histidine phosphatase family protein [Shinella curvata]|uniref:Histidine phosphatase family protein n=1 Tax=Shinella curvata TaxID=1817964 RepID=A0ABT8XIT3_9HYPH|nr:histidine phosphatase family protein [Shinella curvata]MCJ8052545.1 histidine phosphatase family protein [Shinella curvata]MDO6123625.1 histidine phosphatase family protein [Shinella curvata]